MNTESKDFTNFLLDLTINEEHSWELYYLWRSSLNKYKHRILNKLYIKKSSKIYSKCNFSNPET